MTASLPPQVRLANEIAVQFHRRPPGEAAAAIANHMKMFWDPRMRADLFTRAETEPANLDPLVLEAVRILQGS
jgi:formate dehydrogenase subunit delta